MLHEDVPVEIVANACGFVQVGIGEVEGTEIETNSEEQREEDNGSDLILMILGQTDISVDVVVVVVGD